MAQQRVDGSAQVVDFAPGKPLAGGKIGAGVGRCYKRHAYKIDPVKRPIDGYSDNEQDVFGVGTNYLGQYFLQSLYHGCSICLVLNDKRVQNIGNITNRHGSMGVMILTN